jgi:hypothetical protein
MESTKVAFLAFIFTIYLLIVLMISVARKFGRVLAAFFYDDTREVEFLFLIAFANRYRFLGFLKNWFLEIDKERFYSIHLFNWMRVPVT